MIMNNEKLKEIYNKFNLDKEDIFKLKFGNSDKYIITRTGIEKIQAQMKIEVKFELQRVSEDMKSCIILGTGVILATDPSGQKKPIVGCQSFGEVSPANNKNPYPIAMCEKRVLARIVIKMCGLAQMGIYGEDESPDFKR
tara:strand:- start:1845 stop:2264 length:420 start_codon:yes stop_codon:yes gene_type:complete